MQKNINKNQRISTTIQDKTRRALYLNTNILMSDNRVLEIENCKNIIEFNDIYLKIQTCNMILEIWGKNLTINDFNTDGIIVKGEISSIEFTNHKNKQGRE